ncbi:MAG: GatB/YqeY domain-containing protein, partial [Candidatus Saccharimonadales bacterium]
MALKSAVENDLKAALLGGDRFVTETLRGLKAAILNEEIVQNKRDEGLDDTTIEKIVAREVKKRNEAAQLYADNDRSESADNERREAEIISKYLPTQLDEAAIRAIVEAVVK